VSLSVNNCVAAAAAAVAADDDDAALASDNDDNTDIDKRPSVFLLSLPALIRKYFTE